MLDNINVRTDLILVQSTCSHVFEAPIENIDVSHWIFNISDAEYQRCAPEQHIAAGATTTDDGRPMSINVEHIGPNLVIQHYIGEILEKRHFKLVSISDNFVADMHFRVHVNWELSIKAIDGERCEITDSILVHPTDGFLEALKELGLPLEPIMHDMQIAVDAHNAIETPLYAESIARAARSNS